MARRIGIDLGTTNCCMAWADNGAVTVYQSDLGHRTIPSIMAQDRDGHVTVGWDARVRREPLYRYGFAKRHLGQNQQYPMLAGPVRPYTISRYILEDLKRRAETALGDDVEAVITVPAHFHQNQKSETLLAAHDAGLTVIDLLAEPVAAAYAYYYANAGADRHHETILVFDLGGGTMDATVCVKDGERIQVAAARTAYAGDRYLGGLDFDKALVGLAAEQLVKQGFAPGDLGNSLPGNAWLWTLLLSAEHCKHELTKVPQHEWVEELADRDRRLKLELSVTRPAFERAIARLVDKTLEVSDTAIRTFASSLPEGRALANQPEALWALGLSRVSRILLVGGSTLVPLVQQRVEAHYRPADQGPGIERFRPFEAVAIGAALYASSRPAASSNQSRSRIEWLTPFDEAVAGDQTELHELVGRLDRGPASIRLAVGDHLYSSEVANDGVFRLQRISLAPGSNRLTLSWYDGRGALLGDETCEVTRGGLGYSPIGLGRAISLRTIEGSETLIEAGTPAETPNQSRKFFIADDSGVIRIPLFEGVYPIGSVEFDVKEPVGTPVVLRASYSGKGLRVAARIALAQEVEKPLQFEPTVYVESRGTLWEQYEKMRDEATRLINAIPDWVPLAQQLSDNCRAVTIDIETEFANPVLLDPARIEDRLKQLQGVIWLAEAFPITREGFALSIEGLRRELVEHGGDNDILKMLDDLKADLPDNPTPDVILALFLRFEGIRTLFRRRYPHPVSEGFARYLEKAIAAQLDSLRRDGGHIEIVSEAEKTLQAIKENTAAPVDQRCFKLYSLSTDVGKEYRRVITANQHRGLLSSTPI